MDSRNHMSALNYFIYISPQQQTLLNTYYVLRFKQTNYKYDLATKGGLGKIYVKINRTTVSTRPNLKLDMNKHMIQRLISTSNINNLSES